MAPANPTPRRPALHSRCREMQTLYDLLPKLARSKANVLILGESGTGKEVIARTLHELGPRRKNKFIAINCAAVPETLLESELFGYEKGSFTGASSSRKGLFQEADGGTLFLDEIGDMPIGLQAKLLRVLQDRSVRPVGGAEAKDIDFRMIAATHRDLRQAARDRSFREDLFYRLSVVPIQIPPLRQRVEDIEDLAKQFLDFFAYRDGLKPPYLTPEALAELKSRKWEGNVRELENLIERLVVLHGHLPKIGPNDLPPTLEAPQLTQDFQFTDDLPTVARLVEKYILHVYKQVQGHQGRAAEILGLSRRTLYRKLKSYAQYPYPV